MGRRHNDFIEFGEALAAPGAKKTGNDGRDYVKAADGSWVPSSLPMSEPEAKDQPADPEKDLPHADQAADARAQRQAKTAFLPTDFEVIYEPSTEAGAEIMDGLIRPTRWRSPADEPAFDHTPPDEWYRDHVAETPKGSVAIGAPPDADLTKSDDPGRAYVLDMMLPVAFHVASKMIQGGGVVTVVHQGPVPKRADLRDSGKDLFSEDASFVIGKALTGRYPKGKVRHETWDDGFVDPSMPLSPVWSKLYEAAQGDMLLAHTAMAAHMLGRGAEAGELVGKGVITPSAEALLQEVFGVDLDQLTGAQRAGLYRLVHPEDFREPHNQYSAVVAFFEAARQANLIKKIRDVEASDGVAVVIADGPVIWSLKPSIEDEFAPDDEKAEGRAYTELMRSWRNML